MGPGPSISVLPPIRQSCDRCHKQKLRCKRPQEATAETCERCLRKGVKCTYSSSLPKGRPSTYRLSNGSPDLSCSVDLASTIMPAPGGSKTTDSQRVTGVTDLQSLVGDFAPVTADSAGASPDFWSQFMQNDENEIAMTGILPDVDISFDPLPTPPSIQSAPQQIPGQHGQQQYQTIKFVENPPPRQQSGQQNRPAPQRHVNQVTTASAPPSAQQVQNADSVDIWSGQGQLNESIVHLSQLSARLSSLLTSSRDVPIATINGTGGLSADESSAVLQLQSSIGAVFESINSWLAQGTARPPTGHGQQHMTSTTPSSQSQLMSHTLAASSEMTQILYRLRTISNNSTPDMTPPDSSGGGSPLSESSQHPYCTIRYLVVVCVTLLLNTYIAIIISLQHSADTLKTHQWSSSQQHQQQTHQETSVCPWDTMDRIKLQFVGVVQMCSSFMRRQSEVPEMLMPSHLSPELQGTNTSWDAVGKLKVELEQRLRRLQNCLDMVA